jgi:hypothetical protein
MLHNAWDNKFYYSLPTFILSFLVDPFQLTITHVIMKFFMNFLVILISMASVIVPVEAYLDSMEFSSHNKQIVEMDEEFYSVAIAEKSYIEFDAEADLFVRTFSYHNYILPQISVFILILSLLPFCFLMSYSLLYLPPPR